MFKKAIHLVIGIIGLNLLFTVGSAQAALLDLSLVTASGSINDALFSRFSENGQGSGNFDAFVRVQANDTERGYNTDGTLQFDTKSGAFTHSILFNDIPLVNIGGVDYREFLLDAGEPGSGGNTLTLANLEIYLLNAGNITNYPTNFSVGDLMYQMIDANYDSVLLNNIIGNGVADMFLYVPDNKFTSGNSYLYLYSRFTSSGGTYEEWGVDPGKSTTTTNVVPEPASLTLLGTGLMGFLGLRRRKTA